MSKKLFDALDICLQALEQGETVDSVLTRFPARAADLRPILEASLQARTLSGLPVPDGAQRRGRARLLRRAAELREAKRAPRRSWLFSFRPAALTLLLTLFLLSGTNLVRAASTALPGDNLYPLKRTWEDVRLAFVSDEQQIDNLELEYETERVQEINELLAEGRSETVSFSGYLRLQPNGSWVVAGISITISADTTLPASPLTTGAPVRVTGRTDAQGFLVAESIQSVPSGTIVSELDDDHSGSGGESQNGNESASGSGNGAGRQGGDLSEAEVSKYKGILEVIDGNKWIVNGIDVDVSGAIIEGTIAEGVEVIVEGYFTEEGVFIATHVIFSNSGGANGNAGGNSNGDDDDDIPELEEECSNSGSGSPCDDNENDNGNSNDNENSNEDDNEPPDD